MPMTGGLVRLPNPWFYVSHGPHSSDPVTTAFIAFWGQCDQATDNTDIQACLTLPDDKRDRDVPHNVGRETLPS